MIRKCKRIIASKDGKRAIYIDIDNEKEIMNYIQQDNRHLKKFRHITQIILDGHRNPDLYDKEVINKKTKDVTAMKFFKGQENDRIYCKEVKTKDGTRVVITSILHEKKKTNSLSSKEKTIINKVGGYNYDI